MNPEEKTGNGGHQRQATCAVCIVILVVVILVLAILYFALFKPKDPSVEVQVIQLQSISLGGYPKINSVNVTLNLLVLVINPNRAVFYYSGSTAYLYHYGAEVGSVSIPSGELEDQEATDLNVRLTVEAFTFMQGAYLSTDVAANMITLTTAITIPGHVTVLGIFSHDAITSSNCTVNISFVTRNIEGSSCKNNVALE